MPLVNFADTRSAPRVKTHRWRPVVPRARPTLLRSRATRDRRERRLTAAGIEVRSRVRIRATGHQLPFELELVRTTLLVALAVLAIALVLPALLEFAAAAFR